MNWLSDCLLLMVISIFVSQSRHYSPCQWRLLVGMAEEAREALSSAVVHFLWICGWSQWHELCESCWLDFDTTNCLTMFPSTGRLELRRPSGPARRFGEAVGCFALSRVAHGIHWPAPGIASQRMVGNCIPCVIMWGIWCHASVTFTKGLLFL